MTGAWLWMGALVFLCGWACVSAVWEAITVYRNARALARMMATYRGRA